VSIRIVNPGILRSLKIAVDVLRRAKRYHLLTKLEAANSLDRMREGLLDNARVRRKRNREKKKGEQNA
jgi:hypothetical protein